MARALRVAVLAVVALAGGAPGAPAEAAAPLVRVHGTDTWRPVLEVALDEVALLRTGEPELTRPTLVSGSTLLELGRDAAAVRLTGILTLDDLTAQAKALRAVNPGWDVRLVLYTPAVKRSARSRRLLTEEVVVRTTDGLEWRERVSDPLDTLARASALAARAEVAVAEPVAMAPDYLRQRLARKLAKLQRQDKAQERQQFFALKRLPPGERRIPVERYVQAYEEMARMPRHSTAGGGVTVSGTGPWRASAPLAAFLGTWTPLGPGNVGGRTRALVIDPTSPNTLYAGGVAGGVWKTTDGGVGWFPLTDTMLPNLAIASLDIDPTNSNVLYAGTGEGIFNGDAVRGAGIFKTVDGGAIWTPLAATATDDFHFVNKVRVLADGTTVLAATGTGLWRSQDSGVTWTRLVDASDVSGCLDIAVGNGYVLVSCGTFAQGTVYRSGSAVATDGFPFTATLGSAGKLDLAMGRTTLAVAPSNPNVAYALASSTGGGQLSLGLRAVYRSTDGGLTWQVRASNTSPIPLDTLLLTNPIFATVCFEGDTSSFFNQGWYDNVIAVDPLDPNRVWVGGIDLFRSDNGGLNFGLASFWWTDSLAPGAFAHADQHAIVFHPAYNGTTNQVMFVGNDGGIYRTTSARGSTTPNICSPDDPPALTGRWTDLNNGYGVTQFYHGLPYPGPNGGDTFFGGTQDNGIIRGTVATGINGWLAIDGGDGGYVAVDPTRPDVIYTEGTELSIRKSVDGGTTLVDAVSGITNRGFLFIAPFVMSPNDSQILWTGGERMWRTTTSANGWSAASAVLGCGSVSAIAVAPRAGLTDDTLVDQIVFAGTSDGCLFRTRTALGASGATVWTPVTTVGTGYVSGIAFDPTNASTVYVTHSTFGSVHVERSVDGGATFTALDGTGSVLPDVPTHTLVVAPGNPSRLYVGTDVGVFSSDDGGDNWSVENTGFANVITEALAVGQVGGVDHVFAFTHGRGAFRVALPASTADIATVQASMPAGTILLAGRPIAVTDTVKNVGTTTASAPFVVTYALVPVDTTGTPTAPDIPLPESRTAPVLAGQASSQATTSIVLPDVTDGPYRIRVVADAARQVGEDPTPQNNQRLTNTFRIVRPDLVVASVTPASIAFPGGSLNVTHTLRNLAAAPAHAPPSVTRFHLATNQSMASVIGVLGNTSAPGVTAGATSAPVTGTANVVPPDTPPGRYFVIAQANATAAFPEVSTANNVLASGLTVLVGPDAVITGAGATPTGVIPGGNLSVTFTAKNQGGAGAAFDVGFALVPVTAAGVPTGAPEVALGTHGQAITLGAGQTSAVQTKVLTLATSVPAGVYRLRVTADPDNAVIEADESNNGFLALALITVAQPDLVVQSVTFAPAVTRPNGSVTITHVVKNLGAAPGHAPGSTSRLFLGGANDSVAGAFDLGTVRVNPVSAGSTQSASTVVTMPLAITPGFYFVLAVADDGGVVAESNEGNNRGASVTRLMVGPDLVVSAGSTVTGASPGSNVSVTHTIANRGAEAAGPFTVAFALIPVTAAGVPTGASAIPLGPDRTGVVVGAGSAGASFASRVQIPLDVSPGPYRIKITADSGNAVVEADETNNTALTGVLTIARANLTVPSVTFTPAASRQNGSVVVTHVVRNAASAPATAVPTISSLFLNAANASATGALFLANVSVPQIAGGGAVSLASPVSVPLGTAPGLYFVVAQADAAGVLIEPDENNTGASLTRLVVGPDLTISSATAAAGVATGANLSVSYTLRNAGGEVAAGFDVGFRLVPVTAAGAPTGDPEIPLGPNRTIAALAAGVTQTLTSRLLVPATTVSGTYKVRVIADVTAVVTEANEANNDGLTGIVSVARPDLTVPSVTFTPAAVATGGAVTVTHVVKNATAANGGAPASQSAIYLSQNASLAGVLGQLATVGVPALAPSGATTLVRSIDVGTLGTGVYFFVVRADDAGALVEQDEGNNVGISAAGLVVGPDAGVTAASTASGAGPGTNVSVSYTLRNFGVVTTGTFDVGFDVTPVTVAGVPNGAPIALGPVRRGVSLAAGQTLAFVDKALLPPSLDPGTYRIGVTVSGFSTPDATAANDRLLTSGVLTVARPDLAISVFTPPATLVAGRSASLTNTVRNTAAAPGAAGPFGVAVYFSTTSSADVAGDTLVGNRSLPGLAAGGTSSIPVIIGVPAMAGNFFLKAFADFADVVVEANESNNVTVRPVAVVPDLTAGRTTPVVANISFDISGAAPTCLVSITGSGTTSEKITTQNGGLFSGGQLLFADNQGGTNTVSFGGTVLPDGTVRGTFSLSRIGGGGGSGSGTFSGTAAVGSPGALSLGVTGTFTVTGGGTCGLTSSVTFP